MGGEGSGVCQADPDPKGQVALKSNDDERDNQSFNHETKTEERKQDENNSQRIEPTPALLNCSNAQFTFTKKVEDEEEQTKTTPSPKRTKTIDVPKGNINEKKRKYKRNATSSNNKKQEAKEPKNTKECKKKPPIQPPASKQKGENEKPKKDDDDDEDPMSEIMKMLREMDRRLEGMEADMRNMNTKMTDNDVKFDTLTDKITTVENKCTSLEKKNDETLEKVKTELKHFSETSKQRITDKVIDTLGTRIEKFGEKSQKDLMEFVTRQIEDKLGLIPHEVNESNKSRINTARVQMPGSQSSESKGQKDKSFKEQCFRPSVRPKKPKKDHLNHEEGILEDLTDFIPRHRTKGLNSMTFHNSCIGDDLPGFSQDRAHHKDLQQGRVGNISAFSKESETRSKDLN